LEKTFLIVVTSSPLWRVVTTLGSTAKLVILVICTSGFGDIRR